MSVLRCSHEIAAGHGTCTGTQINGGPDPSPWIISIDGVAEVMARCVGRALLGWVVLIFAVAVVEDRRCGRREVLEGFDWECGPVRSVCARLQSSRAEAARREADADQREAV